MLFLANEVFRPTLALIRTALGANARVYDLLDARVYNRLLRQPSLLEEEHAASPSSFIVIDEVQKLPSLLDEVHRLIEKRRFRFLLTGSSARKLRHGGAEPSRRALTRRVDNFARFLDVIALNNGQELRYEALSSDSGVNAKTIRNYVEIIEDTLLGFALPAFRQTRTRKAVAHAKFYLFDLGVVNALCHRGPIAAKSELFGRAFEHFVVLELRAYLSYARSDLSLSYWRSTSHFEVDCIVGGALAIEIKSTDFVTARDLRGLKALREEGLIPRSLVVSHDPQKRVVDGIELWPWQAFLTALWNQQLF
jgi:predicted AAA+ superfamily ATPase